MTEPLLSEKEFREFIYQITHDLSEPLSKVITYSELLSDKLQTMDEEDKEYFSKISENGRRMKNMIEELGKRYGR